MGPSTSTPEFLLLMFLCLLGGAVLWFLDFPRSGLALAGAGVGLFTLHRLSVWGVRRHDRHQRGGDQR